MNKETQDLAWKCLPKEVRDEIKKRYKDLSSTIFTDRYRELRDTFGLHNLTSDTEPEEMLMVRKSEVTELYNIGLELLESDIEKPSDVILRLSRGIRFTLKKLFGDKCLPDKEEFKPKFDIGQKVVMKLNGSVRKISSRQYTPKGYKYFFEGFDYADYSFEQGMEPYTEEKELNLCELLKGCEGEEFYLLDCGNATLDGVQTNNSRGDSVTFLSLHSTTFDSGSIIINPNGKRKVYGSVILYPSRVHYEKYPLDAYSAWMEWKKNNHKTPKTWSELCKANLSKGLYASTGNDIKGVDCDDYSITTNTESPIEKSTLALLKIHQLIEVSYGGNVSYERCSELQYDNVYKIAPIGCKRNANFHIIEVEGESAMNHIMFHTKEQAEEFLSYPENVQLLKDYFMI